MGRKYIPSEEHLKAVEQMAHKGVSHAKMAKALKISYSTFRNNLTLFESYIKKGKEKVDQEAVDREVALVEDALLKRCLGHEYKETHTTKRKVGQGEAEVIEQKVVTKVVQPSDGAIFYYLGNRTGGKWKSVNHGQNEDNNGNENVDDRLKEIATALKGSYTTSSPIPE